MPIMRRQISPMERKPCYRTTCINAASHEHETLDGQVTFACPQHDAFIVQNERKLGAMVINYSGV